MSKNRLRPSGLAQLFSSFSLLKIRASKIPDDNKIYDVNCNDKSEHKLLEKVKQKNRHKLITKFVVEFMPSLCCILPFKVWLNLSQRLGFTALFSKVPSTSTCYRSPNTSQKLSSVHPPNGFATGNSYIS